MLSRAFSFFVLTFAAFGMSSLGAGTAFAHPGHGPIGPLHYLFEPHGDLLPVVVIGIGALAWLWANRPRPKPAPARQSRDDRRR